MKAVALGLALGTILISAGLLRPIHISRDHGPDQIVWLWAWQEGRVEFINSITLRPVLISFQALGRHFRFSARTDPGTEEYYTGGEYVWNDQLAGEQTRTLVYCSEVGITLTLGDQVFREVGGCLRVALLWPP